MDRDTFWALVDRTRAATDGDPDAQEEALREALGQMPPAEIVDFERHASALLAESYRMRLWGAAYLINGGCSDDGFDYFRGWLVAQGRAVYEAALADPDTLADHPGLGDGDVELEGLWYVAQQEYERLTGGEMPELEQPEVADEEAFDLDFDDDDGMRAQYPRLSARFVDGDR